MGIPDVAMLGVILATVGFVGAAWSPRAGMVVALLWGVFLLAVAALLDPGWAGWFWNR